MGNKRAWLLPVSLALALCATGQTSSADEPATPDAPFYEREPYDLVILDDAAGTQIKVIPLNFANGKLPSSPRPTDKLRLRRFEDPDEEYDVQWQNIAEVKLFEQLVLEQAKRVVAEGKFNEAFDYFEFLRREYPKCKGLDDAISDFLYEEAKDWQRKRNYENAVVLLHTLYDRQSNRTGLELAMVTATGKIIEKHIAAKDYATARRLVRDLRRRFPKGTAVERYEKQMNDWAVKVVDEGAAKLAAGDPQQALALARRAMAIWPKAPGTQELADQSFASSPHVVVAVTAPYAPRLNEPMTEWSARRTRRLVTRRLFEFTGYGADGGEYECPFGRAEITDLGRGLAIEVAPNIPWLRGEMLTGYDIARRLLELAEPDRPDYLPTWAEACQSIDVRGVNRVDIRFHAPQLLAASLLTVSPVADARDPAAIPSSLDPYKPKLVSPERTAFVSSQDYFARTQSEPQTIVEQRFATRSEALDALEQGEVAIVDRLAPWEVDRLKGAPGITIERYAVPTIDCLLPNLSRPFMRHRGFRRAILYGIDRQRILAEQVLKRQTLAGCEVVSGPFAKGAGLSDPAGYAYDDTIAPRAYEPRLAMTLSAVALRDVGAGIAKSSGERPKEIPTLTLAHPADEVARIACQAIQKNLQLISLPIQLREIPYGQPTELGREDDLLYLELSINEPLVDARRLFDEQGIIGNASTYMSLVLRQLEGATGWNEARQSLHDLHRLAYDEVSVMPLWQLVDYYAYNSSVAGLAVRPASLYQRVEQWQAKVPQPMEEP
jgi:tetratricopeptide (TPR) repeat protein